MSENPPPRRAARAACWRGALLCLALAGAGGALAADDRFAQAKAAFAEASASGNGEHEAYDRAHALWRALAEDGDVRARYHIGILHLFGLGKAEFDHRLAMENVRAAADGGYPQAQSYMGLIAETGDGSIARRGDDIALEWWRKAAEGGHCAAIRRMARAYGNGELGLSANAATADAWAAREAGCSKN
jgi:TPR repeat protein